MSVDRTRLPAPGAPGAFVFPPVMLGMMLASATRSPRTPRTRRSGPTTARSSLPIRQVPTG